ncbi:MAG: hypothetical protein Q9221_006605 [Calogaya cf. arnoldii]
MDPRWWFLLLPIIAAVIAYYILSVFFLIKDSRHQRRGYGRPNRALMYLDHELQSMNRYLAWAAEEDHTGEHELQSFDGHTDEATDGNTLGEPTDEDRMNGASQGSPTMSGETAISALPFEEGVDAQGTQSARGSMDITSTGPVTEENRRKLSAEANENVDIVNKGVIKATDRHRSGFEPQSSEG